MGANREYKSTLFSELFSEPHALRELYNAIADTSYGEDTVIEINTLESAFFNDIRNDVSFTIDNKYVVLLEHQSLFDFSDNDCYPSCFVIRADFGKPVIAAA